MEKKTNTTLAVVEVGGKQYLVSEGDVITCEKMASDKQEGDALVLDKVLLVDDGKNTSIGSPYIEKASVNAEIVEHGKGKKTRIVRFKAKSNYHSTYGHRQPFTKVKITGIKN